LPPARYRARSRTVRSGECQCRSTVANPHASHVVLNQKMRLYPSSGRSRSDTRTPSPSPAHDTANPKRPSAPAVGQESRHSASHRGLARSRKESSPGSSSNMRYMLGSERLSTTSRGM